MESVLCLSNISGHVLGRAQKDFHLEVQGSRYRERVAYAKCDDRGGVPMFVRAVVEARQIGLNGHRLCSVVRFATATGARSTLRSNARGGASIHARALPPVPNARETGSDSHAAPRRPHVHSSGLRAARLKGRGRASAIRARAPSEQISRQVSSLAQVFAGQAVQASRSFRRHPRHLPVRPGHKGRGDHFDHRLNSSVTNLHNCTPLAGVSRPGREQS